MARGAGAERAASDCASSIPEPIAYDVQGCVEVRAAPSPDGKVVAFLPPGAVAYGFPGGVWLRLEARSNLPPFLMGEKAMDGPLWAFLDGLSLNGDSAGRLVAQWSQVVAHTVGTAGELRVEWSKVQDDAKYHVEWRLDEEFADTTSMLQAKRCGRGGSAGGPANRIVETFETYAILGGLPLGALVRLRVDARISSNRSSAPDVHIAGSWGQPLMVPSCMESSSGSSLDMHVQTICEGSPQTSPMRGGHLQGGSPQPAGTALQPRTGFLIL